MDVATAKVPLTGLNQRTRTEAIRDVIEEHIARGGFPPGTRLDLRSLAEAFCVSRTPLREALIQLSAVGIASMRSRRGVVIPEFTPATLMEMFEIMAEFEAMCARYAARRMSDMERALLAAAHEEGRSACAAGDVGAYWNRNEAFHRLLYVYSHSNFLAEQTLMLFRRLRPYWRLELQSRRRVEKSFAECAAVVEALIAADGDLAADLLRKHMTMQGDRFAELLVAMASIRAEGRAARKRPTTNRA